MMMRMVTCMILLVSWLGTHSAQAQDHSIRRCGTHQFEGYRYEKAPSDCGMGISVIKPEYAPGDLWTIKVVVHFLHKSDETGKLPKSKVTEQIKILNEDFRAMAGTPGEGGTDTRIQFVLADTDPNGNPTDGVTYTENDEWFEDATEAVRAQFGAALAWDTERYLNLFVNSGGGSLGYVAQMPWQANRNPALEGAVVTYMAFGYSQNEFDANLGRTATHEIGHYLGLEHTFGDETGCPTGDCYTSGDLICDTEPHGTASSGCDPTEQGCSGPAPIKNYMNYASDNCMNQFTPEQVNRMRCSISQHRAGLINASTGGTNADQRWLPHLTSATGGFETTLFFSNQGGSDANLTLTAYDNQGQKLGEQQVAVSKEGRRVLSIADAFGQVHPSHFSIAGSTDVLASAAYKRSGPVGVSAHLQENQTAATAFLIHLGEWQYVFDGLAVINVGSSPANLRAILFSADGSLAADVALGQNVPVHAKYLADLQQFLPQTNNGLVRIESDQPLIVLALRGSKAGAPLPFLFANPAMAVP